jgi:hypothetical protein
MWWEESLYESYTSFHPVSQQICEESIIIIIISLLMAKGIQCLLQRGGALYMKFIFGHPSDNRSMLLSLCDRTPSSLTARPSSSSKKDQYK